MSKNTNSLWLSIIGLLVALTALSYNTWRNEQTESNRNIRASGFEMLRETAHLQLLVDRAFYSESVKVDPIEGWTKVNFILSLSHVMPKSVQQSANQLKSNWEQHWQKLYQQESANKAITQANRALEKSILNALEQLD